MRGLIAVFAGLLVIATANFVAAQPAPAPADASSKANAMIEALVHADTFSGTVLVARDGAPVFRKAYGLANREWAVPNTPDAKFRLGSLTKAFTATAILQLQEAGKLSIDDPVSKYYPAAPAAWKAVTLRHLLTHTSGIPSYTDIPGFFDGQARLERTPEEIIRLTQDKPLQFAPGSQYAYDNTGYIILGYIVEKVSGEGYADYLQKHIFQPLGMTSSGYDSSEAIIVHRAAGYDWQGKGFVNTPYLSMSEPFAAGSLYSTLDDMLKWDQALYGGKLLGPASLKAMFTDYGHSYGFGWEIDRFAGHDRIHHDGGINGFVTEFARYPGDRLTVVVLSNETTAPVSLMADNLAAIYLNIPPRRAAPGGEAAVRRLVDEFVRGAPDYARMSPELAESLRKRLPVIRAFLGGLGTLQAVALLAADPGGGDRYKLTFSKGAAECSITLEADGKVDHFRLRPLP